MSSKARFPVLSPALQISLYSRLHSLQNLYFKEGLRATVEADGFNLQKLDQELYLGAESVSGWLLPAPVRFLPKGLLRTGAIRRIQEPRSKRKTSGNYSRFPRVSLPEPDRHGRHFAGRNQSGGRRNRSRPPSPDAWSAVAGKPQRRCRTGGSRDDVRSSERTPRLVFAGSEASRVDLH